MWQKNKLWECSEMLDMQLVTVLLSDGSEAPITQLSVSKLKITLGVGTNVLGCYQQQLDVLHDHPHIMDQ